MAGLKQDGVVVVGGGLIGVSTLYELAADGIPAVLLEAQPELACGASHANGGLLTPGLGEPWNSPGVLRHLLASLFDPASPMKLRLHAIPGLSLWGLKFLGNARRDPFERATAANFLLSAYSLSRTRHLAASLGIDYDARAAGCLKVFAAKEDMHESLHLCRLLAAQGLRFEELDTDGVLALEPSLRHARNRIAAGLFYPDEASGDARAYTLSLAAQAVSLGATIRTAAAVQRILVDNGRVTGVAVDGETIAGDVVLAAGIDTPALSRGPGLSLAIKPAKGYSLTVDARSLSGDGPRRPVLDQRLHAAVSPLGDRLRFVGTAEFAGRDKTVRRDRINNLFGLFERLFPRLVDRIDPDSAVAWAGLRPMTADGMPYIGAGPLDGLWINSGHGHMGWSMSSGSARLLVDLMQGRAPAVDPAPFRVMR